MSYSNTILNNNDSEEVDPNLNIFYGDIYRHGEIYYGLDDLINDRNCLTECNEVIKYITNNDNYDSFGDNLIGDTYDDIIGDIISTNSPKKRKCSNNNEQKETKKVCIDYSNFDNINSEDKTKLTIKNIEKQNLNEIYICGDCNQECDAERCSITKGSKIVCFDCSLHYEKRVLKDPKGKCSTGIYCSRCKSFKHPNCFSKITGRSGAYCTKTCHHCLMKQKLGPERKKRGIIINK